MCTHTMQVDCVANDQLCRDQNVRAFPTLRLFNKRTGLAPDYTSVRPNTNFRLMESTAPPTFD